MSEFSGTSGLIIGVANKRSIAWAIAKAVAAQGARLAVTYQGDRLGENVKELAEDLADPLVLPLDVTSDEQIADVAARCEGTFGGLDFVVHGAAFAPREEITRPFLETSRDGFRIALDVSAYSLIAVSRATAPLLEKRGGGSILTLTYLGSDRVFPNYNVMGVAKAALESSVRYLAAELGERRIRVNCISAGPINTLAGRGISGFTDLLRSIGEKTPLKRNTDVSEVGDTALYLASPFARGVTGEIIYV